MNLKQARAELAALGIKLKRDREWAEYRVEVAGRPETSYHTDNLEDAVGTGFAMARQEAINRAEGFAQVRNPFKGE